MRCEDFPCVVEVNWRVEIGWLIVTCILAAPLGYAIGWYLG